jgi:hypothetical protein
MGWSKDVSKQWTVYDTPSLTCETSGGTTSQHPMHLRTCNRESTSPQMAISSPQSESPEDMPLLGPEESKRHYKDIVHEKHSNMNEITEVNNNELHCLHEKKAFGPHMAAMVFQPELIDGTGSTVVEELR